MYYLLYERFPQIVSKNYINFKGSRVELEKSLKIEGVGVHGKARSFCI